LVLEFQNELAEAREENNSLKKRFEIEDDIERYEDLFVTRKSDNVKTIYCAPCWDTERKLIQVSRCETNLFRCPHCKIDIVYNPKKYPDSINQWGKY
jgi:transposase-like protein